jgi:hypothetical protein
MARWIAKLTMAGVAPAKTAGAEGKDVAGGNKPAEEQRISVFTRPQALTYPVAVALVKGGWEAVKTLHVGWLASPWVPLLTCLVIGGVIAWDNLRTEKPGAPMYVLGVVVGILNSLVMYAAVLGIGAVPTNASTP